VYVVSQKENRLSCSK